MNKLKTQIDETDHIAGNPSGSINLVEYGDYQCPHCRKAHPIVKRLLDEFSDVKFAFRNFPLRESHPFAMVAAQGAEAAGLQDKFYDMHDALFEHQDELSDELPVSLAEDIGLQIDQFLRQMNADRVIDKIESDVETGLRSGVNGTPTFFLNGIRVDSYDETYQSLASAVRNVTKDERE